MDNEAKGEPILTDTHQYDIERSRLALEFGRLKFDRQKSSIEALLKRRELNAAKPRQWKDLLANPLALAIVGGFITLVTTTIAGHVSASNTLEADLIKKAIDNPDPQKVRENLQFLIEVKLVEDYADRLQSFLNTHPNSALPSAASTGPSGLGNVHTDDDAIDLVIRLEGGWVDNPRDPQGASKYGISLAQLSAYTGQPASQKDLFNLSVDTARDIYRKSYLTGATSAIASVQVKAAFLSLAVSLGPRHAVMFFQQAISAIDKRPSQEDGYLGAETISRINSIDPDLVIETVNCKAAKYYQSLPSFKLFGQGWIRRLRLFSPVTLKGVCPDLLTDAGSVPATTAQ